MLVNLYGVIVRIVYLSQFWYGHDITKLYVMMIKHCNWRLIISEQVLMDWLITSNIVLQLDAGSLTGNVTSFIYVWRLCSVIEMQMSNQTRQGYKLQYEIYLRYSVHNIL